MQRTKTMFNENKDELPLLLLSLIMGVFVITFIYSEMTGDDRSRSPYTFEEAVALQIEKDTQDVTIQDGRLTNAGEEQIRHYMQTEEGHYPLQHLDLREKVDVDAETLDDILEGRGMLEGYGKTYLEAQNTHDINALYLISHTQIETGNGDSDLARGIEADGRTYYNFFGIGAFDRQALEAGSSYAAEEDWSSPERAIMGGAAFISRNYVHDGQNTLYKMRWNPEEPGTHQYATDIRWAVIIADIMASHYNTLGLEPGEIRFTKYREDE